MTTTYVSIDVATKSLALGIYTISDVDDVDKKILPIELRVVDLNSDKKSKDIPISEKAVALKNVLNDFDAKLQSIETFVVLIEYQMNANYMTNAIFNMLVYHYAGRAEIHTVFPSLKNSIALHKSLTLSNFLSRASNNYQANKNHCKYNFMYFMTMFNHADMCSNIKQKNLDDIADTFMQCIAYHYRRR